MKTIKRTVLLLLVLSLLAGFAGCGEKNPSPEDTLYRFCDAVNELDIDSARECLCAEWNESIDAALDIFGGLREDSRSFFRLALSWIAAETMFSGNEFIPEMNVELLNVAEKGETAVAEMKIRLSWEDTEIAKNLRFDLCLENGKWLICGIEEAGNGNI